MHHFDVELERRQLLQRSRLERVRQAIEGQQMRLSVQPVIDLASGALCFAEALVRWQHPQQGLLAPEDWLGWIGAAVARHPDLPASALRLEVLETAALEDLEQVARAITRCRDLGVSFALDDFGTGYSSLT